MAVSVVFRRQAEADLENIADGIASESPGKAAEFIEQLRERCRSLGEFPDRAAVYRGTIRRLVAGRYLAFYRIADPEDPGSRRVIILRVLHGAMDIDRLVDPDGE